MNAPSAFTLQRVISEAMSALDALRSEQGQVIETEDEILTSLQEEGIDLNTVLDRLIRAALDAKAAAAAATLRMDDLQVRKTRFQRREETCRQTLLAVMQAVELRKFATPEASLTITDGRPKVIITDEAQLPPSVIKTVVTRTPDKGAILSALRIGDIIPGAVLGNAPPVLRVLTK